MNDVSALAIRPEQAQWTGTQQAALRQLGLDQAPPGDLAVFLHFCQRTGLDPFAKQVYMIGRYDTRAGATKWTIQTSIDGFRLIARRAVDHAGERLGYEDTMWCGKDGQWVDVWLEPGAPAAARVVVLRNGMRFPAVALYTEYADTRSPMWRDKGTLMLAKVAEALALRKACPADLSGVYTDDEMASQGGAPQEPIADEETVAILVAAAIERAGDDDGLKALWREAASLHALAIEVRHDDWTGTLADLILRQRAAEPAAVEAAVEAPAPEKPKRGRKAQAPVEGEAQAQVEGETPEVDVEAERAAEQAAWEAQQAAAFDQEAGQ